MFSMTGLTRDQVCELKTKHHIYLLPSGRLSITGCKHYAQSPAKISRLMNFDSDKQQHKFCCTRLPFGLRHELAVTVLDHYAQRRKQGWL